jgi:cytochrome c peroxidase
LNPRIFHIIILLASFLLIISCTKDIAINATNNVMQIPEGFPAIEYPVGNEYTEARWKMGKQLFYDTRLSLSNNTSCASCHHAQNAFSDTVIFSLGDKNRIGKSNAPTLTNIAYNPYYTRAGGVPTLEMQILVPIQEHDEFNSNIVEIVQLLKSDSNYVQQARVCYNRELDPYVLVRAIANFERSLISGNADYDKYTFQNNKTALSAQALRGQNLFMSTKTNCSNCHSGFNFTNYAFENNGLYINYTDSGKMRLTQLEQDRAKFKVPTLRNIALTAPYMHDGSLPDLATVIAHYNSGGQVHKNKSQLVKPLGLSQQEQNDLIAFLQSLTDHTFINNKRFQK